MKRILMMQVVAKATCPVTEVRTGTCCHHCPPLLSYDGVSAAHRQVKVNNLSWRCIDHLPFIDLYFFLKHQYMENASSTIESFPILVPSSFFYDMHINIFYMIVPQCVQFCVLICSFILQSTVFIFPFVHLLIQQTFIKCSHWVSGTIPGGVNIKIDKNEVPAIEKLSAYWNITDNYNARYHNKSIFKGPCIYHLNSFIIVQLGNI